MFNDVVNCFYQKKPEGVNSKPMTFYVLTSKTNMFINIYFLNPS